MLLHGNQTWRELLCSLEGCLSLLDARRKKRVQFPLLMCKVIIDPAALRALTNLDRATQSKYFLSWLVFYTRPTSNQHRDPNDPVRSLIYPPSPPPPNISRFRMIYPATRRTDARAVQLKADVERSENSASHEASSAVDFVGLPARSSGAGVDLVTVLEALFEVSLKMPSRKQIRWRSLFVLVEWYQLPAVPVKSASAELSGHTKTYTEYISQFCVVPVSAMGPVETAGTCRH